MQIRAHNVLTGTVAGIKKGATNTIVFLDIDGAVVTTSIPNLTADDLNLVPGLTVYVVINSTGVMIAID